MNLKRLVTLLFIILIAQACATKNEVEKTVVYQANKIVPAEILPEVKEALSYFPDLKEVPIRFVYKESTDESYMQAQPSFAKLFNGKNKRTYNVFINSRFKKEHQEDFVGNVPSDVLVGWIGHELGHIADYRDRTATGLLIFGLRYISSEKYLVEVERTADVIAVERGMADFILDTKRFILKNPAFSEDYKSKISALYLSPKDILALLENLEEDVLDQEDG